MKLFLVPAALAITAAAASAQSVRPPIVAQPSPPPKAAPPVVSAPPVAVPRKPLRRRAESPAVARVARANRSATQQPQSHGYVNAVQVYPFSEGAIYQVYTAPGAVTDIALQAGEGLVSVAAGDTVRWVIGDTTSGAGDAKRTHVLVKPFSPGLATNIFITTDRRSYHLQLTATPRTAMAALSWTYPADELIALRRSADRAAAVAPIAAGVALDGLHFDYRVSGDRPAWRPLRAFDDGRQTFVEFSPSIAVTDAPPLFVIGASGEVELVNYRVQGRFYVVDRIFDAAELRLGTAKQQIVRIERLGDGRARGSKRS
ncbi:P-type conjugative transfer protein TrbG [Novosphingobium sp. G106]|uniref:P-type conjugative transfer protein TrbG n=1 Tax=Novosphingobium sp. G106 TaxID=2849500 RepID=UPI001C2DDB6D|nr:P-type conjugative transfer protein TrbG [Novosphingobium sp. G106]MBV1691485.1 P-type conjugative transfer protein TrbG [Novosphingobium sp. G106]